MVSSPLLGNIFSAASFYFEFYLLGSISGITNFVSTRCPCYNMFRFADSLNHLHYSQKLFISVVYNALMPKCMCFISVELFITH
jgi:hypothetical protein